DTGRTGHPAGARAAGPRRAAGLPAVGGRARQPAVRAAPAGPPGGRGELFVRVPPILLSTSSCYPSSTESCFADAARLGYDGVEVMVWKWPETRDAGRLTELAETYGVPVLGIHSPTLLLTQRVWGSDAWGKIDRSVALAEEVGAEVVVVHPPFRWQKEYASAFVEGIARRQAATHVRIAVENMFPWKARAKDGSRTKERHAYL